MRPGLRQILFGGFTPRSIPGLRLWLDAGLLSGFANDDPVGTWADLSGLGNSPTQATGANQPLFKTAAQNGLPGVESDGSNDTLAASYTLNQPCTRIVVAKYVTAAAFRYLADGTSGFNSGAIMTDSVGTRAAFNAGTEVDTTNTVTLTSPHVYAARFNGAGSSLYIDNAQAAAGNAGAGNPSGITLFTRQGGGQAARAQIYSVFDYAGLLSDGQVAQLSRYLGQRWGIAVS